MGRRLSVFRDATGAVRSGWVVATFALVAVVVTGGVNLALHVLGLDALAPLGEPRVLFLTLPSLLGGSAATLACAAAFGLPTSLEDPRPRHRFTLGFGLGGLALSAACAVPAAVGAVGFSIGSATVGQAALHLLTLAPAGVGEELLLRGLGFRALARGLGPVPAIALTSGLFGGLHLMNPAASPVAALIITLVGAWFGTLAWRTGSLWLPMGLHVGWNFFEGFVYGHPVSGLAPGSSLLVPAAPPVAGFWSGGAFGPEAAGWTAVVLAVALALSVRLPRRAP